MSLNKKLSLRNNCICMYFMFSLHDITQYKLLFSLLSRKLLKKHSNVHKETHEDLSSIFSVRPKLFHVCVIMILAAHTEVFWFWKAGQCASLEKGHVSVIHNLTNAGSCMDSFFKRVVAHSPLLYIKHLATRFILSLKKISTAKNWY